MEQFLTAKRYPYFLAGILVFLGLYLTSLHHYLLFHSLAEIFSIVVACGIFMIAWNSRQFFTNNYLLFIGIAYLFVAGVDLIHTLAYKGMGVFQGYETNLATQLWIATRYMVGLSFLIAPLLFRRKLKINLIFLGYIVATSILLLSIFYWNIFPVCFIEGVGLTPFKKISEYIISLILLASIILLFKNRGEFARNVFQWIVWSIIMAIACELAFTFYIHAYGFSNMVGHFFGILSFYFIYKAIIETGLTKPHDLLFRNLKQTEVLLREEKNKIQGYLDIAGVVLVAIDSDQKVTLINKKGGETLGYDETEIIGKNWFDTFIPERDRDEVKADFKKLMDGEVEPIEYFENPILTRSGEERIMAWHNSTLRDEKNNIISILSSGEDIAERKKMEGSLAQLASFPELNPNPVVEVDLTGHVSYINPAAKQLFPDLQMAGLQHPWLAGLESLSEISERQGKRSHVRELKIGDAWYEQTIHCVSEGKRLRIYGLDITERKEAEGALKNALEGSKQRGAEISALLESSRAVLEYHEFKDSAQSIFDSCKNLIGATAGYVALLSKDGAENEVLFLDSGGLSCTVDPSLSMPIRGLREEAYRTGKSVFHNDFSKSEYVNFMPIGHADLHNVLFAPLVIKEKVTGLIGLANKPDGFTENDARMASAFGELAAIALHNSRMLESLEKSEEHFRSVVQTANDAIISIDKWGNIIFWNNSAENIFGYSAEEVTGKPLTFLMPERFREAHQKGMNLLISTGKSKMIGKTVEMFGLRKDGHEFPVELSLATWKTGEETFFTGIIRDITERKQTEELLRRSHDELETRVQERTEELAKANKELADQSRILESFFKHTITPLVFLDREFNFIRVNEAYAKACQRDVSEFPGHNHFEFYPSDAKAAFEQVVQTKVTYQAIARPFTFPDHPEWGKTYWNWTLTPILDEEGEVEFLVFSLEDVTERTRAANKLEEQANLLELAHDAIIVRDLEDRILFWNHGAEEMYGWKKSEALEKVAHDILQTEFPILPDEIKIDLIRRGKWEDELVHTRRDGKKIIVESRWALQQSKEGHPTVILQINRDITERKRAEEALKVERQRFNDVLEMLPAYLVLLTPDHHVPFANRFFRERFGESHGQRCFEYLFGRSEPCEICETYTALKTMAPHEWEWTGPDGRNYDVFDFPFTDTDGSTLILEMGIDITERKEIENRTNATNALLNLFAKKTSRKEYLDAVVELIRDWSKCRCVGIRVLDEREFIPYESYIGFSQEFWESENWLSIQKDQCICIRVVTGKSDLQDNLVITPGGSFRCDNTIKFVNKLSEEEKSRYRGVCIQNGFLSVTIIPIHYLDKIVGAIHLADEKEAFVPSSIVEFLESITPIIGEAVNRFRLEEEVHESEQRLRSLSSQLLTAQENERKQVARDLHDGIGQMLSAIKFKIEDTLQKKGKGRAKLMAEDIHTLIPMIRGSIEEVRKIQMDLRPSTLDDLGIVATIGWFCREFQKIYSTIHIEKQLDVQENEIAARLKTVAYRILQEAMNNIAKHSKANLIRLALRKNGREVELAIEDNGIGFDLENYQKGFGLESMKERVQLSGGTLTIESTIGKGTIIKASWPI